MKLTTNLNLKKPDYEDDADIAIINENMDKIDVEISSLKAYAVASGTNTYTATIAGITALTEGMPIRIKFANANSGVSTLNINSLGAKAIVKSNGSALSSGNIKAGQICNLAYTGSNFQLLGEGGEYGTATASEVLSGKTIGMEEGLVSGTMPNREAVNQNLTTEGQEYTIPAGYHNGLGKVKAVITGLVASVIKAGTTVGGIAGNFTNDATATAAQMLSGVIAYVKGNKITGTMVNRGAVAITPSTSNQAIAQGYHNGSGSVAGSANFLAENIKDGVNMWGKIGTLKPIELSINALEDVSFDGINLSTLSKSVAGTTNATLFIITRSSSESLGNSNKITCAEGNFAYRFGKRDNSAVATGITNDLIIAPHNNTVNALIYNPFGYNITYPTVSTTRLYVFIP